MTVADDPQRTPDTPERKRPGMGLVVFVYVLATLFVIAAVLAFVGAIKNVDTSPRPVLIAEGVALVVCAGLMIGGLRVMHRRRRD